MDGRQLEAEEQARWEDIRLLLLLFCSELAEWHECGPTEEEKVRLSEVDSADLEEAEEKSLPSIPEGEAEPAEKVRCTSTSCARRSQWPGLCGCPFALKEVAGVMLMCAEEDGDR